MQSYIHYLKTVLGIRQVITEPSSAIPKSPKITVWVEALSTFSDKDQALLKNMLQAMKISEHDLAIYDLSDKKSSGSAIEFELVKEPQNLEFQTYSPQVLHENRELKTVTWAFLQTIMKKYNETF